MDYVDDDTGAIQDRTRQAGPDGTRRDRTAQWTLIVIMLSTGRQYTVVVLKVSVKFKTFTSKTLLTQKSKRNNNATTNICWSSVWRRGK